MYIWTLWPPLPPSTWMVAPTAATHSPKPFGSVRLYGLNIYPFASLHVIVYNTKTQKYKNTKTQKRKNTKPPHQEQQQQVSGSMGSILFHVLPLMCISFNNQPLLYVQWCPCFVHFKLFPIPFKGQCMVTNDHEHFLSHGDHVLMYIPQYLPPDPAHCSMGNKINWTW